MTRLACTLICVLLTSGSNASPLDEFGLICAPIIPGGGQFNPPETCADTAVGGQGPADPLPFQGVPVSSGFRNSAGGLSFQQGFGGGLTGTATADVGYGLLRVSVVAESPYGPNTQGDPRVVARSLATFNDKITIGGSGTGGAPLAARGTLKVDGLLEGDGEVLVTLLIGSNLQGTLVNFNQSLFGATDSIDRSFDLPALADGEELLLSLTMRAQASAGSSINFARNRSSALYENSAFLFLDVLTPDAGYTALSGHDYRTTVVPGPPSLILLLTGAAALAGRALRRRP